MEQPVDPVDSLPRPAWTDYTEETLLGVAVAESRRPWWETGQTKTVLRPVWGALCDGCTRGSCPDECPYMPEKL